MQCETTSKSMSDYSIQRAGCAAAAAQLFDGVQDAVAMGTLVVTLALGVPTIIFSLVTLGLQIPMIIFCFKAKKAIDAEAGAPTRRDRRPSAPRRLAHVASTFRPRRPSTPIPSPAHPAERSEIPLTLQLT